MDLSIITSVLVGCFITLLLLGFPVAIVIALSSMITMFFYLPFGLTFQTATQSTGSALTSFSILAIPLFIFSGAIMNTGGLAIRLVNFSKLFTIGIPGALMQINILSNMLFGALSGSALAAEVAVGKVLSPIQAKENYDPELSAAVNITSCPTGLLIPPSNTLIMYSLASGGTSISALFLAGYIPGILMGGGIMIVALILGIKHKYPKQTPLPFKEVLKIIWDALPSLLMIVTIIGGIIGGVFTATEGAAVAVVYSLALSYLYKNLNKDKFKEILHDTLILSGISLFLIGVSSIMSWVLSFSRLPILITDGLLNLSSSPTVILLIINVVLLIVGTFMDLTPALLIFTPIFFPVAQRLGIHPVHFGIIMNFNLALGLCTPPVGNTLFVGCSIANIKMENVIKRLIPFFLVLFVILLLVTFIPEISLFLPRYFKLI
ncbi:MAG: TRAP transporter large permease [Brevinema sp.]